MATHHQFKRLKLGGLMLNTGEPDEAGPAAAEEPAAPAEEPAAADDRGVEPAAAQPETWGLDYAETAGSGWPTGPGWPSPVEPAASCSGAPSSEATSQQTQAPADDWGSGWCEESDTQSQTHG